MAHWGSRVIYCDRKGKAKSCTYRGQHDKRFYKTLSKFHKILKTPKEHAKTLESRAGYSPPDGWLDQSKYFASKSLRRTATKKHGKRDPLTRCIKALIDSGYTHGQAALMCSHLLKESAKPLVVKKRVKK